MSNFVERLYTPLLVVAAAAIATSVVKREFFAGNKRQVVLGPAPTFQAEWQEGIPSAVRTGPANSPVTIVELADLECPACRGFHGVLKEVMAERPGEFSHVFVHFPLGQHRFAVPAAKAAECAKPFNKFSELVDVFFEKQDSLGLKGWGSFAADAGISDTLAIATCATSRTPNAVIDSGRAYGTRLGVRSTPTLIINGWMVTNPPGRAELLRIVDVLKKGDKAF
jgi:protein-disulfide isomerase